MIVTIIISVIRDALATQIIVTQKIIAISELSTTQKENYREKYTTYKISKFYVNRINKGIITIKSIIIKFIKEQISISYYFKLAKKIFLFLIKYFKLPDQKIKKTIYKYYCNL